MKKYDQQASKTDAYFAPIELRNLLPEQIENANQLLQFNQNHLQMNARFACV